jgi:hypothetical protein
MHEFFADCEAETGAAVGTFVRVVDLTECAEEEFEFVAWDADAGVFDGDVETEFTAFGVAGEFFDLASYEDVALFREFDGVAQ